MRQLIIIAFICFGHTLLAQEAGKRYTAELDLNVDNDAFYLVNEEDQYYSSGIFAAYRHQVDTAKKIFKKLNRKNKLHQVTHAFHFFHLMYTPFDIKIKNVDLLDRPYAGAFGFGKSVTFFTKNNWVIDTKLDFGILGPATKTGELQNWWHERFNMKIPRGWEHQINNTPYVNLTSQISKSFTLSDWIDLTYESDIELGTIFNNIQQGGVVRIGHLTSLKKSGYRNGMMGIIRNPVQYNPIEWYFFWGYSKEFVIHNTTIDGNFIGPQSPYTEESNAWVSRRKTGIMLHWQTFDAGLVFNYNTAETTESQDHKFIRIRLTKRI